MTSLIPQSNGGYFQEFNGCHLPSGSEAGGRFCSAPDAGSGGGPSAPRKRLGRTRGGPGYRIVFRSALRQGPGVQNQRVANLLTPDELRKAKSAKVYLTFEAGSTAHLGAPLKWMAPNGVTVVYDRGQRRSGSAETAGLPSFGVFHDFNVDRDEKVIPLTRNMGSGRRALRAWAAAHLGSTVTARMSARQMVRPGD